jgi:hypothetical protein
MVTIRADTNNNENVKLKVNIPRPTAGLLLIILLGLVALLAYWLATSQLPILNPSGPTDASQEPYRVYGNPSDYQLVYLIAPEAEDSQNEVLASIPDITQAKVAHNWQEVLNFHAERPVEALIVDRSGYPLVDKTWTAAMARQGLVIATINLYAEQTELRDSDCDRQKPPRTSPFPEDYFLVTAHLIQTENPAELEQAIEMSYITCKLMKSTSRVFESSDGSHSPLDHVSDVMYLTNSIIGSVDMIRDAKTNLAALSSPPTVDPEFAQQSD